METDEERNARIDRIGFSPEAARLYPEPEVQDMIRRAVKTGQVQTMYQDGEGRFIDGASRQPVPRPTINLADAYLEQVPRRSRWRDGMEIMLWVWALILGCFVSVMTVAALDASTHVLIGVLLLDGIVWFWGLRSLVRSQRARRRLEDTLHERLQAREALRAQLRKDIP